MDKAYISLVSVCVGWLLSQLTEYIKNKAKKDKLKKAVKSEIADITSIIFTARNKSLKNSISYGHNGCYTFSLSSQMQLPITEKYYTEIFSLFTDTQRQNYRMLMQHLNFYNQAVKFFEDESKNNLSQNMIIHKLFTAYKHLAFAHVFITALSSDETIDDHHPKLVRLREHFKKQIPKLALLS